MEYTFGNKHYLFPQELKDDSISGDVNVAGFHAKGFFDKLVDIDICFLQEEPTNALRKSIKQFALDNDYSFYDIRAHQGCYAQFAVACVQVG